MGYEKNWAFEPESLKDARLDFAFVPGYVKMMLNKIIKKENMLYVSKP